MISQSERDAVPERLFIDLVLGVQEDAAIAAIAPFFRIEFAEGRNEIGLAMKIHPNLFAGDMIDADGAAAFGFRREITRLAPLQGFLYPANAFGCFRGVEDQPAQRQ